MHRFAQIREIRCLDVRYYVHLRFLTAVNPIPAIH